MLEMLDTLEDKSIAVESKEKRMWTDVETVLDIKEFSNLEFNSKSACIQNFVMDISTLCKTLLLHSSHWHSVLIHLLGKYAN